MLDTWLAALPQCLRAGGRVAVLTFHSGEDRRVKKAFQAGLRAGLYAEMNDEVVRAGPEERRNNPRASSAKLRWAVRSVVVSAHFCVCPPKSNLYLLIQSNTRPPLELLLQVSL